MEKETSNHMSALKFLYPRNVFIVALALCILLTPFLLFAQAESEGPFAFLWKNTLGAGLNATFSVIGTLFISLSGLFALIAGMIFDALIQWTVVDLIQNLEASGIMPAVHIVWTAFRDIANILIIGMFVFIAISIIVGLKRFGEKQMIARVLVVAVLINFSLLFTNLIVGSSNFVSSVFYKESLAGVGSTVGTGPKDILTNQNAQTAKNTTGIAGAFLSRMGFASLWNTPKLLTDLFKVGYNNNSTTLLIGFSLMASVFLIMIALFFLYGSFLVLSRAVLLIFLMITSSLAFASYLLPDQMNKTGYGWSKWWESLIGAALFGPLLMILLWASLVLLQAPATKRGNVSLVDFIQNPGDQNGWIAIIMLLFTTGFLYASFKIASNVAGGIGGFNYAAMGPAMLAGWSARLAAFGAQQSLGRGAAALSKKLGWQAKMANLRGKAEGIGEGRLGRAGGFGGFAARRAVGAYDLAAQKMKGVASRDLTLANTMLGKEIAKTASLQQKTLAGESTKGYLGAEERAKEKFARQGERVAFSKEEQEKLRKDVSDAILKTNPELAERHRSAEERESGAKKDFEKAQKTQVEALERQTKEMETLTEKISGAGQALENAQQRGASADELWELQNKRDMRETEKASAEIRHQTELAEHTNKIKEARQASKTATQIKGNVAQDIATQGMREGKLPEKFGTASETAFDLARDRFSNTLRQAAKIPLSDQNDTIAKGAAEKVRESVDQKRYTRIADIIQKRSGGPPPGPTQTGH